MDARDREKLQRHYPTLLEVTYSSISPHLISTFVLTLDMHDEIESKPTERKKMEKLLSILPSRGDRAFKELIRALKPSYGWVAKMLENQPSPIRRSSNDHNHNQRCPEMSISNYIRDVSRILQRCTRVSTHWTFLAYSMSLMPTTIMDIKREMACSGGYEYVIFALLEAWITKVGSSRATFAKLISLLEREGMHGSGEEVAEYWTSLSYPDNLAQQSRMRERSRSPIMTDV